MLDDNDAVQRYRDMLMLRHVGMGLGYDVVGRVMNVSHMTVRRRVAAMPADLRRRFGVK